MTQLVWQRARVADTIERGRNHIPKARFRADAYPLKAHVWQTGRRQKVVTGIKERPH